MIAVVYKLVLDTLLCLSWTNRYWYTIIKNA